MVIFGLMATGKTTLARTLGQALGLPVIESDRVRKTLVGLEPTARATEAFGQGIYAADFSSRTYAEMRRQAAAHLAAGQSVILDGSYKRAGERRLVRQLARESRSKYICGSTMATQRKILCETDLRYLHSAKQTV